MNDRVSELPTLSEAQLEVMNVLWDRGEATLGETWSQLNAKRPLARNTVQTLLSRLVDKGWVTYRSEGTGFIYRASRERQTATSQILQRVLKFAFQGSTEGLMMSLLQDARVSADEARRLKELIDEAERKSK